MNLWFRMYSEFADDPKVQMMPEVMQRRLTMLMCLKCKGRLGKLSDMEIAFELRISTADASDTKSLFLAQEFIDDKWDLVNWNKRQFLSDSSTDRVRRHRTNRIKKQDETLHETKRNVTVTAPEQNRTEQNLSDAKASSPRRSVGGDKPTRITPEMSIYREYPRKEGFRAALKAISNAADRLRKGEGGHSPMESRDAQVFLFRRAQSYAKSPAGSRSDQKLVPHPATWFNQSRYLDDDATWEITDSRIPPQPKLQILARPGGAA